MTVTTTGDVVVDFIEDDLAALVLDDQTGDSDRLVPFHFPTELESVALERRFVIGIVDGPELVSSCFEKLTIDITGQWRTEKLSRARMLQDVAAIRRRARRWNTYFEVAHVAALKAPTITGFQYDYTSVLGWCFVTIAVALEYHVDPTLA